MFATGWDLEAASPRSALGLAKEEGTVPIIEAIEDRAKKLKDVLSMARAMKHFSSDEGSVQTRASSALKKPEHYVSSSSPRFWGR